MKSRPTFRIAGLYFESEQQCRPAVAAADAVRADILEFTNATPVRRLGLPPEQPAQKQR